MSTGSPEGLRYARPLAAARVAQASRPASDHTPVDMYFFIAAIVFSTSACVL